MYFNFSVNHDTSLTINYSRNAIQIIRLNIIINWTSSPLLEQNVMSNLNMMYKGFLSYVIFGRPCFIPSRNWNVSIFFHLSFKQFVICAISSDFHQFMKSNRNVIFDFICILLLFDFLMLYKIRVPIWEMQPESFLLQI